jgi:molecular chaperone GrpE
MATDENNLGGKGDKDPADSKEPAATPAPSGTPASPGADPVKSGPPSKGETAQEVQDRKNAAKAFYRAMYAGEDVEPEQFGIGGSPPRAGGGGGPGVGGGGGPSGPCPNCTRMEKELAEAEKTKTEAENYYKRILADFENYRKRTDRERDEAISLGIQKAVEAILPALDDLDRAKAVLATVSDPRSVTESLNLVFARFAKTLEPLGIKPMEVVGEPFDPKFHEPVQEVPTTEFADGAVMQELRKGYMMRDKVIRPSLVNVASNESGVVTPAKPVATEAAAATAETAEPIAAPPAPEPGLEAEDSSAEIAPVEPEASAVGDEEEAQPTSDASDETGPIPAVPPPIPKASLSKAEALVDSLAKEASSSPANENRAKSETDKILASARDQISTTSSPTTEIDIEKISQALGHGKHGKSKAATKQKDDFDPLATADVPVYDPEQFLDAGGTGEPSHVYEISETDAADEETKEADFAETAAAKKQVLDE